MRRLGQLQRCGAILYQQRWSQIGFLQLYEVWIELKEITVTLVEQVYRIFTSWMLHFPFPKRQLEHWRIPGELMYSRLCPDHFAPSDLWTPSKPAFNDGISTQCLFNLMADMKWGWVVKGANCPFTRLPGSWIQVTHPTHKLKVAVSLGDELSVKGPRKGDVEDGVAGHLTW